MWDFVRECLPACAAIKSIMGQVKRLRDLKCCGDDDALFVNDTTRFKPITPREEKLVGSYLFYTDKHGRVIRSGKAYGREQNFGVRMRAHKSGSFRGESFFYRMYPDESKLDTGTRVMGCFQDLQAFIGFAFDKDECDVLLKDSKDGGLMRWSEDALKLAQKFPIGETLREKQIHMVTYTFEIVDDMMIEPRLNVSESGSMEPLMKGKGPNSHT